LNRKKGGAMHTDRRLIIVAQTLLHAVTIEDNRSAAYETRRLFAGDSGDASRLAGIAEHVLERSSTRRREDCTVYLCGMPIDPAPYDERFTAAIQLPGRAGADAPALRLMA
jgi:hypothetical protein